MRYIPYHEVDKNSQHYIEIKNSIAENGWVGLPLLAIGEQLVNGSHRFAACQELGIEPLVHEAEITLNWGDEDDWLLEDLADANDTDSIYKAIKLLHECGYIDDMSYGIIDAEYHHERS